MMLLVTKLEFCSSCSKVLLVYYLGEPFPNTMMLNIIGITRGCLLPMEQHSMYKMMPFRAPFSSEASTIEDNPTGCCFELALIAQDCCLSSSRSNLSSC